MKEYAYTVLEVGGIQKYILATGKLKEMIGGSKMIESLGECALDICHDEPLNLQPTNSPHDGSDSWYILLQDAAGTLRFLFPNLSIAHKFLTLFSAYMLETCPGLPLYGTTIPCQWTVDSLKVCYKKAKENINLKRGQNPMAPKSLWSFSKIAPLDGLPAVDKDKEEAISVLSKARRHYSLLENAKESLKISNDLFLNLENQGQKIFSSDAKILWPTDMQDMLPAAKLQRIALIHIDGNDLGQQFRACLEEEADTVETFIHNLKALSDIVKNSNESAFREALLSLVQQDIQQSELPLENYTIPLRPLVLGGDDLTVIVRADLAFAFIQTYAEVFEKATKAENRTLSVGAGMVIMQDAYPFVRAFHLVEQLTENAKKLTKNPTENNPHRPSSVDYLVLTNDVPSDLSALRERAFTAQDGNRLTAKPFYCGSLSAKDSRFHLEQVLADASIVLDEISASAARDAIDQCRKGNEVAQRTWKNMCENIIRGLGGRKGQKQLTLASFKRIFPDSFFIPQNEKQKHCTFLGDYIELRHLNIFRKKGD